MTESAFATRQHLSIHNDPGAAVRTGPARPDQDRQLPVESCVSAGGAYRTRAGVEPNRKERTAPPDEQEQQMGHK